METSKWSKHIGMSPKRKESAANTQQHRVKKAGERQESSLEHHHTHGYRMLSDDSVAECLRPDVRAQGSSITFFKTRCSYCSDVCPPSPQCTSLTDMVSSENSQWNLVFSTSPHFFSSTRGDDCDLCPSCSVRTNRGMACVLLRVLPFILQ